MRTAFVISLAAFLAFAAGATAREMERAVPMMDDQGPRTALPGGLFGVNQGPDTFYYGGTVWDAVDGRWEAASPASAGWANKNMWTFSAGGFNGVAHSGENMDGWVGVDNTVQAPDYFDVKDNATLDATCVIAGDRSLFCGATNAECYNLCFMDNVGTGYGNSWNQAVHTPTYAFISGEQISLGYDCAYESEAGFDFTHVILQTYDTMAGEFVSHDTLVSYSGIGAGPASFDLDASMAGLEPVYFRIVFQFVSDGGYSDGDGLNPTSCGAFALDNYSLDDNGTVYSEDFEGTAVRSLPAGWGYYSDACGDYAHSAWLADLPVSPTIDPCYGTPSGCSVADSVLVLFDAATPAYPHPLCQDNFVMSPVIDIRDHPGLSGHILNYEMLRNLPLNDHVFRYWQVRYSPACASGGWSGWVTDNFMIYGIEGTGCYRGIIDFSSAYIPPEAEQVQVGLGVINYCDEDPWELGCTYTCNTTPYYDNVTFGIWGSDVAPVITQRELDYFQDQFAEDGSLNPLATADTRTANYLSNLVPPIFGDTMVCRGGADNTEVWLAFRLARVSPKQVFSDAFFTWFPNVQLGGWFGARMDTAEVTASDGLSTGPVGGVYATCFHESDPVRVANGLGEIVEILPNQVFQPGTRVEYYLKACYGGSSDTLYLPADGPSVPEEFEILPTMVDDGAGSVKWPCLLYADHFGQRGNEGIRNSARTAAALTAAGYEFDTYNRLGPTSDLRNGIGRWAANPGQVGGPGTTKYNWGPGATLDQMEAYSQCILNCGNVYGYSIYQTDGDMLKSWLTVYTDAAHARFLWVSGDSWARDLNRRTPWGPLFLNGILGATYLNNAYAVTANDYTYCLQVNSTAGGAIVSAVEPFKVRQNGCPRNFNIIGATGSGVLEEEYDSQTTPRYAAVSNAPGGVYYRTFVEAYDHCLMRDGSVGLPTCGPTPLSGWFTSALTWGGHTDNFCDWRNVDVKEPGVVPAVVTSLGQAFPNPMNPTATIKYTIGTPGKVQLRVFDVSGRVIRTLVDEAKTAGAYSVIWDGKNDGGDRVASGVFFYQLNAPGTELNKKIVILQ